MQILKFVPSHLPFSFTLAQKLPPFRSLTQVGTQCEDLCLESCSKNLYRVSLSSHPFSLGFLTKFSARLTILSVD